jgi:hypothetical protein
VVEWGRCDGGCAGVSAQGVCLGMYEGYSVVTAVWGCLCLGFSVVKRRQFWLYP